MSCTIMIAWYILGCTVYVLVCTEHVHMYLVHTSIGGNDIQLSPVLIRQDSDQLDSGCQWTVTRLSFKKQGPNLVTVDQISICMILNWGCPADLLTNQTALDPQVH